MDNKRANVAIFGSTGSVGQATLEVIEALGAPFRVWALSAHENCHRLLDQIRSHNPQHAVLTRRDQLPPVEWTDSDVTAQRYTGPDRLIELASHPEVDIVVAAIVGVAGLESSLAAAQAGKRLGLANKEALVVAGSLLTQAAQASGAELLPIDSEHSAIFQALQAGRGDREVRRVILTASGGSLRNHPLGSLPQATVEDALKHPTWSMGKKITIDSATMMNKSLEVIEARWMFNLPPEKIEVVIHPQSIIHSMVEFVDGSVLAQLSPPDMKLPIQYALTYPDRLPGPARLFDWRKQVDLGWSPVDLDRYPALELGFEVAHAGGTSGAVLNGANEAAVDLFLNGEIRFTDIVRCCRAVVQSHTFEPNPTLESLLRLDQWARQEVRHWKSMEC